MAISYLGLLLLSSCISVYANQPFILRDCGAGDNPMGELKVAKVSPDPIRVPGDVTASGEAQVYQNPSDYKMNLVVEIQRYLGFFWVTVPCISNVGSCTYDACDLLSQLNGTCPAQMVADNIPCTCDTITVGTYKLNNRKFTIPKLSGVWSWLATGDYKLDMKLVDKATNKELACIHGEATIADGDDCDGFLCSIFG